MNIHHRLLAIHRNTHGVKETNVNKTTAATTTTRKQANSLLERSMK